MSASPPSLPTLEAALAAMPSACALVDLEDGRVVFENQPALALGGAANDATDASGQRLADHLQPSARVARGESLNGDVLYWQTPQGRRALAVHSRSIPDASGPRWALLTFQDAPGRSGSAGEGTAGGEPTGAGSAPSAAPASAGGARDEFLSIATHELRSPLQTLQLVLQRLQRQARKSEAITGHELTRQLEPALRQLDRMVTLVQNLLDVTRIRTRRFVIDPEPCDFVEITREVVSELTDQVRMSGSSLELETYCDEAPGDWDRTRVEQVIANLVSNAAKYGSGKPIVVSLSQVDGEVALTVKDQGTGIAAADQARIFDPFERAASTYRAQSLGLGLYIVREIVKAHGGSIQVDSVPGQGSSFTVRLPAAARVSEPSN